MPGGDHTLQGTRQCRLHWVAFTVERTQSFMGLEGGVGLGEAGGGVDMINTLYEFLGTQGAETREAVCAPGAAVGWGSVAFTAVPRRVEMWAWWGAAVSR